MRKMDEMELAISLKAMKAAWLYVILFLIVWTIYDLFQTNEFGFAFLLLISQNLVYSLAKYCLKRKLL